MAAGLGFIEFSTGDVLSAAAANGYLASQTVMVFASAAARTSAITSPQEGMFSYLKDTNATQYYDGAAWVNLDTTGMVNPMTTTGDTIYSSSGTTPARLGIGSTGQVLTVSAGLPSWATPTSGGYTQISSTNISGSGTSISSIPATYQKLVLVVQDWYPSTNAENLRLRFNSDATAGAYGQAGVSGGVAYSNAQNFIWASYQGAVNSDNNNFLVVEIDNYANTNSHKVANYSHYYLSGSTQMIDTGAMRWKNTAAINSIDFAATTGNIGQGTAILWGVK